MSEGNETVSSDSEEMIREFDSSEGVFLIALQKDAKNSRISFTSETPLSNLYKKIVNPNDFFEGEPTEDWKSLQTAVGSVAKIYEQNDEDDNGSYSIEIVSNYFSSKDFRHYVLEPMCRIGLIPNDMLETF